jgi:hypothetical protein
MFAKERILNNPRLAASIQSHVLWKRLREI